MSRKSIFFCVAEKAAKRMVFALLLSLLSVLVSIPFATAFQGPVHQVPTSVLPPSGPLFMAEVMQFAPVPPWYTVASRSLSTKRSYYQTFYNPFKHSRSQHTIQAYRRLHSQKSGIYRAPQSPQKTKFFPVFVKKRKKKQKIISIDRGFFIPGGSRAFGTFRSLKACIKACAVSATCFAGDYDPWTTSCYFHTNFTACGTMSAHTKITHFKKVPCVNPGGVTNHRLTLGASLKLGIERKSIKNLNDCINKCVNAGTGIASRPQMVGTANQGGQLCFGIDYDFGTHKCFHHIVRERRHRLADGTRNTLALCRHFGGNFEALTPVDLVPSASTINIIFCPPVP